MSEDYKVKTPYVVEEFDGDVWTTYKKAKKRFDALTKDYRNGIIDRNTLEWCELIYSPLDGDPNGSEEVIESVELTEEQKRLKQMLISI